jgi:membrane protein
MERGAALIRLSAARLFDVCKRAVEAWLDDFAPSMGAAISYYTMFSIAPLLLIVLSVVGLVFDQADARQHIVAEMRDLVGASGAQAIQQLLSSAASIKRTGLAAAVGVVVLMVGATSVFSELETSINRIWRAPAAERIGGLWGLLRTRLLSFGMILGIGFVLAVSLALSAALAALGGWWGPMFGGWQVTLKLINALSSFGVITFLFAMIYKFLPRVSIGWTDVWTGAVVTALLFELGKELIGLYIGTSGVTTAFGAAGSLAVLLLWVYYSAQVFLLGAEFTWVYAHEFGSLKGQLERPKRDRHAGSSLPPAQISAGAGPPS